jgi:hypothetical protein
LADPRSALPEESLYKHYPGTGGEENRTWADLDPEADFWSARDVAIAQSFSMLQFLTTKIFAFSLP